eukprot:c21330_g1_i1.p1 GENE.c21330_g1_i1~~c21330_g1_i1.p1  ORF type:complete len:249 (+),score=38.00 c21330_g1_i1:28-747(+)
MSAETSPKPTTVAKDQKPPNATTSPALSPRSSPLVRPAPVLKKANIPPCPPNETPLHSAWSFWFDKRLKNSELNEKGSSYLDNLNHLCCFNSVESFWRYYCYLIKPSNLREANLHLFREAYLPMWESFPNGGCWILKVWKKSGNAIDHVWEAIVLAAIGELFEEPDLVGVVLSSRSRQIMISVWNRDNQSESVRFAIGEKLKQLLSLSPNTVLEYKKHCTSMKDNSTFRNAKLYVAGAS